jgi:hypothetical protein
MYTLATILSVTFFAIIAVVGGLIAVAISRGKLSPDLTHNQRLWTTAVWSYWSLLMVACLVSIRVTDHTLEKVLNIALGVGLLCDLTLPRSEQPKLVRNHLVIKILLGAVGLWLIVDGLTGLV